MINILDSINMNISFTPYDFFNFELNSMKMITSPMINPLAPLWSVYLNPFEKNISPMINLFQYMKVNISPMISLWKFMNMHTFN